MATKKKSRKRKPPKGFRTGVEYKGSKGNFTVDKLGRVHRITNPPKEKWIPVHAVKFLKSGLIQLMK